MTEGRRCIDCRSDKGVHWRKSKNPQKEGWLCNACYARIYIHKRHDPRRIRTANKTIRCKENPRKGVCSRCGRIGRTGMFPIKPDPVDPAADFRELCRSCGLGTDFEYISVSLDAGKGAILTSPTTIMSVLDPSIGSDP